MNNANINENELKIPTHIAFIMDGNRRWARAKSLPTVEGHRRGYGAMKNVAQWCLDYGIKYMTVYAFSTENWKRSKEEVEYLMDLLYFALTKDIKEFDKKGIKLNIIGDKSGLSEKIQKAANDAEEKTKNNTKGVFNIAVNYGGRLEIVQAVQKIIQAKIPQDLINEELIFQHLYTANQPDPDIVVRTSGETRLSGFLTWQSVYSELFFIKTLWPDFSKEDLNDIILTYNKRERRFGGN